eukprot:11792870-Karenia_brevis.AAC.1
MADDDTPDDLDDAPGSKIKITADLHDNFGKSLGPPVTGTVMRAARPKEGGIPLNKWWNKVWTLKRITGWHKCASNLGIESIIIDAADDKQAVLEMFLNFLDGNLK